VLSHPGDPTLGVDRLDRRLTLEAAETQGSGGLGQEDFGFYDQRAAPTARVLFGQGDEAPLSVQPGATPGLAEQHQGQEPFDLGLLGQEG
jgi:hypothetical protein